METPQRRAFDGTERIGLCYSAVKKTVNLIPLTMDSVTPKGEGLRLLVQPGERLEWGGLFGILMLSVGRESPDGFIRDMESIIQYYGIRTVL